MRGGRFAVALSIRVDDARLPDLPDTVSYLSLGLGIEVARLFRSQTGRGNWKLVMRKYLTTACSGWRFRAAADAKRWAERKGTPCGY